LPNKEFFNRDFGTIFAYFSIFLLEFIMSLNTISSNATVDYATFRSGVNAKDITAPFYADISKLDGVDWNYTTMTETALASTSTTMTVNGGGFEVDSDGFFTTDFNKAAGIPDNIKIH
jgi:hypothetical protein